MIIDCIPGSITCMFVVSAAIGEMVIPLIVGKVFDYIGPISFLAESCILCVAALGSLLAVLIIGKGLSNTHRGNDNVMTIHLAKLNYYILTYRQSLTNQQIYLLTNRQIIPSNYPS